MNDLHLKVKKCSEQHQNNGCIMKVQKPSERDPQSQSWKKLSNKVVLEPKVWKKCLDTHESTLTLINTWGEVTNILCGRIPKILHRHSILKEVEQKLPTSLGIGCTKWLPQRTGRKMGRKEGLISWRNLTNTPSASWSGSTVTVMSCWQHGPLIQRDEKDSSPLWPPSWKPTAPVKP